MHLVSAFPRSLAVSVPVRGRRGVAGRARGLRAAYTRPCSVICQRSSSRSSRSCRRAPMMAPCRCRSVSRLWRSTTEKSLSNRSASGAWPEADASNSVSLPGSSYRSNPSTRVASRAFSMASRPPLPCFALRPPGSRVLKPAGSSMVLQGPFGCEKRVLGGEGRAERCLLGSLGPNGRSSRAPGDRGDWRKAQSFELLC